MGKGYLREWRKGVRAGLGVEVTVVIAPDNTTTQKCQIWGFFLLSVPWFGLCYFPPQSTLVVLGDLALEEKTEASRMGFRKIRNCLGSGLSWASLPLIVLYPPVPGCGIR
jgi:hypothetical protein